MVIPDPPVNVRLVFTDDDEVPVDTVYAGYDSRDDTHYWDVVSVPREGEIRGLNIEILPAQTAVRVFERWEMT